MGLRGGEPGAGRLREGLADEVEVEDWSLAEGTNEGDATERVDLAGTLTSFEALVELLAGAGTAVDDEED